MNTIDTKYGPMDEALLIRLETSVDSDEEHITTVEYCPIGCTNESHLTGRATGIGSFCADHVHRSVHVTKKRWPDPFLGVIKDLTQPDDLKLWAQGFVDELLQQRAASGSPIAVTRELTPAQFQAVQSILVQHPELGSISR